MISIKPNFFAAQFHHHRFLRFRNVGVTLVGLQSSNGERGITLGSAARVRNEECCGANTQPMFNLSRSLRLILSSIKGNDLSITIGVPKFFFGVKPFSTVRILSC